MDVPSDRRLRNIALLGVAVVCLAFAGWSLASFWRQPSTGLPRTLLFVCTKCNAEIEWTRDELKAQPMDESNFAVQCPECKEMAAYQVFVRCAACGRAIPDTPGRVGTAFQCPFCKAPLGSGSSTGD